MKPLPALIFAVVFPLASFAHDIAVYARGEAYVVNATAPDLHTDDDRAFWNGFKQAVRDGMNLQATLPLISPPEWGKTVSPRTRGQVDYRESFPGGFLCHLRLSGLEPDKLYILTLNGNPNLPGNALLPTPVPGLEEERYYDFAFIETDASGGFEANLGIKLPVGDYEPRIYVKDTEDFKIVLYRDYFPFTVE